LRIYRIRKFPSKLFVVLLIVSVIFFTPKLRSGFANLAFNIFSKPFNAVSGVRHYFLRAQQLSDENIQLKQRLATMSISLAKIRDISQENHRLYELLDFKRTVPEKTVVARVTMRDIVDWRNSIIINRGRAGGIKEHMPCATAKGLVGSVIDVANGSSKVMLITDPNSKVGVVLERSRESGILVGMSEGLCKAEYLSIDADVKKGDRVLTAGFSAFFPKGLIVGTVVRTEVDDSKLYKYAVIDPACDMNRIEEVICIDITK